LIASETYGQVYEIKCDLKILKNLQKKTILNGENRAKLDRFKDEKIFFGRL
jgi:hypothetical protein